LRLAIVHAVSDIVQKQLNFLDRDQIANVLGILDQAKHKPHQFAVRYGWSATVAEV
jgi:hypothetical protein